MKVSAVINPHIMKKGILLEYWYNGDRNIHVSK